MAKAKTAEETKARAAEDAKAETVEEEQCRTSMRTLPVWGYNPGTVSCLGPSGGDQEEEETEVRDERSGTDQNGESPRPVQGRST